MIGRHSESCSKWLSKLHPNVLKAVQKAVVPSFHQDGLKAVQDRLCPTFNLVTFL
jgi:hypothetical protein